MKPSISKFVPSHKAGKRDCAFTLTELVVVLGLVVVLAALLLPAQAGNHRKAGIMECKNNLKQVGMAIDMYTRDYQGYLPGPIWSGVYYTYRNNASDGMMAYYLWPYLELPPPTNAITFREADVLKCPAAFQARPLNVPPSPPLGFPISFISTTRITNGLSTVQFPFGRPNTPFEPPKQTSVVKRPSDQWAISDLDKGNVPGPATYSSYLTDPVHTERPGGPRALVTRNYLYFDWSVRPLKTSN